MDNKELAFEKIISYEKDLHKRNKKRIQIGIRLLLIIPLIFLAIMFKMESNKVIFLTFWIVSLFGIALYLIFVEYMDYELQVKLKEFGIRDEDEEIDGLIYDRMDMEKLMKVASVLQESFTLEEDTVSPALRLEDKSTASSKPQPQRKPRPESHSRPESHLRSETHERPTRPRPDGEQVKRRPKPASERPQPKEEIKKMQSDAMAEFIQTVGVEQAEEELMASIKRYVAEVNKNSTESTIVEPRKSAEDYAKMRKARAKERLENEED